MCSFFLVVPHIMFRPHCHLDASFDELTHCFSWKHECEIEQKNIKAWSAMMASFTFRWPHRTFCFFHHSRLSREVSPQQRDRRSFWETNRSTKRRCSAAQPRRRTRAWDEQTNKLLEGPSESAIETGQPQDSVLVPSMEVGSECHVNSLIQGLIFKEYCEGTMIGFPYGPIQCKG